MDVNLKNDKYTSIDPSQESRSSRGLYAQARLLTKADYKDARMATASEFRDSLSAYSLIEKKIKSKTVAPWNPNATGGIPVDYDSDKKLVYADNSDSHTLLIGATGSKKSRLVVMPAVYTLAAARESMIICDPKAEIYKRTAAFLQKEKYQIGVLNLREPELGDSWNILSIPYRYYMNGEIDKACEFINDLTVNLIPVQDKDPYWDYSSRDLLFGLILLLFQISQDFRQPESVVNISSVLRLKTDLFSSTRSESIKRSELWKYVEKHETIRARLMGIVICPSDTMSCILSVFDQHMSSFKLQPRLVEMMSSNTLRLDEVGFKPHAIFLIMPDEKSTYHKIVTVFIKQIYEYLIGAAYKASKDGMFPIRVNFLLDEFSSLPMIADFPQMIAASRSRNIRFTIIVQSKHQLRQRYEDETETIQSNCGNWMFLYSRELDLLREISELAGRKNDSPLIPVSSLQHLDKEEGECLVFCGRTQPYLAHLADISEYDGDVYQIRPMLKNYEIENSSLPPIRELFPPPKPPEMDRERQDRFADFLRDLPSLDERVKPSSDDDRKE